MGEKALATERFGILGGTFDPVHHGHLSMARAALDAAGLDRVMMLPSGDPPHKTDVTPAEDRWRMLCAACAGDRRLVPDRMELDRKGKTYTFDTLTRVRQAHPSAEIFYIIGADTVPELCKWHRYEEVLKLCTFLVCPRRSDADAALLASETRRLTAMGARLIPVPMQPVDVSSTRIRAEIRAGGMPDDLSLPVYEYARLCGLYGREAGLNPARAWMPRLFQDLTSKRFAHSMGVVHTARALALLHHVSTEQAETAALLHDCAKCLPLPTMQSLCDPSQINPSFWESGALLHAPAGARLAEEAYGVHDPAVLHAIAAHTTGAVPMNELDCILYLADKIEPGRDSYPLLEKVRSLSRISLKAAMIESLQGSRDYVLAGGRALHPQTLATLNWFLQQKET